MARPPISHTQLSPTLGLSECHDGFWLYDTTQGMNLAMRAKTRDEAFIEALTYYQDRLKDVEGRLNTLSRHVADFIDKVSDDD